MVDTNEIESHLIERYEVRRRLGKGAYGIVWKATERKTNRVVALKKIFDAFRNATDAQRTFREILFLQEFSDHQNIIKLLNVVAAKNDRDIYLVFEFMETDLHAVIRKGGILQDAHQRYIMAQLLRATAFLHSGNVIHRDHKPSNVLLDSDCLVKICDFGLARSLSQLPQSAGGQDPDDSVPALTEYVATRWYRAPEILLSSPRYTKGVDMWSLGCILAEMLLGKPLFPGDSTFDQIERIVRVIPTPSRSDIEIIGSQYAQTVVERAQRKTKRTIQEIMPKGASEDGIDLIQKLLVFNPEKRPSAEECLNHRYVSRFHSKKDNLNLGYNVIPPINDDVQLTVDEYRKKLYTMIKERRNAQREERDRRENEKAGGDYKRSDVNNNNYESDELKNKNMKYEKSEISSSEAESSTKANPTGVKSGPGARSGPGAQNNNLKNKKTSNSNPNNSQIINQPIQNAENPRKTRGEMSRISKSAQNLEKNEQNFEAKNRHRSAPVQRPITREFSRAHDQNHSNANIMRKTENKMGGLSVTGKVVGQSPNSKFSHSQYNHRNGASAKMGTNQNSTHPPHGSHSTHQPHSHHNNHQQQPPPVPNHRTHKRFNNNTHKNLASTGVPKNMIGNNHSQKIGIVSAQWLADHN